jgi:50S ribosomal protein L16 3-hydroxylase
MCWKTILAASTTAIRTSPVEHPGRVEEYELERLRSMMIDMIRQPEDFKQWFGSFVTTPRHELDIAPAEPAYEEEEVVDALMGGEKLSA